MAKPTPPQLPSLSDKTTFLTLAQAFFVWLTTTFMDWIDSIATAMDLNDTIDFSSTNITAGLGAKTFTVSASKSFVNGMYLVIASSSNPTVLSMVAQVDSYSGTTLNVNVISVEGEGTSNAAWDISLTAKPANDAALLATLAADTGAALIGFKQSGTGAVATTVDEALDFALISAAANASTLNTIGNTLEFTDPADIVIQPSASNKADPAVADPLLLTTAAQLHRIYNSGTGALSAQSPSTLGTFAATKKYDVVAGTTYTASIHGAPLGNLLYFSGSPFLQFFNTDGSFHSQITSGFTRTDGDRAVTFTVPAGAERVAFNIRDFVNWSNTNPMTATALELCLNALMLNEGATALPFEAYSNGVFTPTSALFNPVQTGEITVVKQGNYFYLRSACQQSATKDVVWRLRVNHGLNYTAIDSRSGVVDFYGIRFIDKTTESGSVISAFNLSTQIHSNGIDESCPTRINSMYVAGGHGVIGYTATKSAHGKANVDVGSIWSDGTSEWVLYYINTVDLLTFVRRYTGAADKWTISSTTFGSTTLTHVSGATNTASIVMTASAQLQFVPIVRDYLAELRLDDAAVTVDGVYTGNRVVLSEVYALLNVAKQQDYLIANVGSGSPAYTSSSIQEQIRFYYEYELNKYGAMSIRAAQGVKDAYRRGAALDYWGGIQLQRLSLAADTTPGMQTSVHMYVPEISTVSGYNFQAIADVTANAAQVYLPKSACVDPADPASHFCLIGKTGATTNSGHLYGYNRLEGLGVPATRAANIVDVMFLSSSEKQYPIAIDSAAGDSVVGDVESITSFRAPFLPTDATLTVPAVVVDMSGKTFIYITSHQSHTNKLATVPALLNGRSLTVVKASANFTLNNAYVRNNEVEFTVTGGYGDAVLLAELA